MVTDLLARLERQQEELLELEANLRAERIRRESAEHLARGLVRLSATSSARELAEKLPPTFANILGADACTLLVCACDSDKLLATASTDPRYAEMTWPNDEFVRRVASGESVIVARARRHPGWQAQPDALRRDVGAALHFATRIDDQLVMLVAVHRDAGFFSRDNVRDLELVRTPVQEAWRRVSAADREAVLRRQTEQANRELKETQTALLEARDTAEDASKAKSAFLAQMSHELRTPLAGIISLCELAVSPKTRDADALVRQAGRQAEDLLAILNDILDISKIEAGRMALEEIDFDLQDVLQQIETPSRLRAVQKGIDLRLEARLPEKETWRVGDPLRLKQILLNLISNAIKFTDEGEVVITAAPVENERNRYRFTVEDTGCGIPESKLQVIFEEFRQADQSTSRRYGGSGLGLAICDRLVHMFGGRIWAESEVGKGTRFIFEVVLPQGSRARPRSSGVYSTIDCVSLRVVVAEDNPVNQLIIRRILEGLGHQVSIAADGVEALEIVPEVDPDVVLMDLQMPNMDGFEATAKLRAAGFVDLPIVALTANAMPSDRAACMAAGMHGFLSKPIRRGKLLEVLHSILRARISEDVETERRARGGNP